MLKNKLIFSCLMTFGTMAFSSSSPVVATTPSVILSIQSCTIENGKLGDANPQVRDFCLSQTNDTSSGKAHHAVGFAIEYYNAVGCTSASTVLNQNCQNAASIISNGTILAFHLDYTTLSKIRSAVPPGSSNACSCPA